MSLGLESSTFYEIVDCEALQEYFGILNIFFFFLKIKSCVFPDLSMHWLKI